MENVSRIVSFVDSIRASIVNSNYKKYLVIKYYVNGEFENAERIEFLIEDGLKNKYTNKFKKWWKYHTDKKLPNSFEKIIKIIHSYDFNNEYLLLTEYLNNIKIRKTTHVFRDGSSFEDYTIL